MEKTGPTWGPKLLHLDGREAAGRKKGKIWEYEKKKRKQIKKGRKGGMKRKRRKKEEQMKCCSTAWSGRLWRTLFTIQKTTATFNRFHWTGWTMKQQCFATYHCYRRSTHGGHSGYGGRWVWIWARGGTQWVRAWTGCSCAHSFFCRPNSQQWRKAFFVPFCATLTAAVAGCIERL